MMDKQTDGRTDRRTGKNNISPDPSWGDIKLMFGSKMFFPFNPYLTNGFAHHYHLDESTFILGDIRSDFKLLFTFSMNFLLI